MIDLNKILIGSDPEYFASYEKYGKKFVEPPVIFRVEKNVPFYIEEQDTEKRHPIFVERDGIKVMEDGVAFEYTLPPVKTPDEMFTVINKAHEMFHEFLYKWSGNEYKFYNKPVINFEIDRYNLDTMGDEIFNAMIFGCDKDYDAIDREYNCKTIDASEHNLRYGGGHIHIGSKDKDTAKYISDNFRGLIILSAICIGNTAVKYSRFPELEKMRAEYYGNPGRYRPQPHGLEYRSLSNSWTSDLLVIEKIFSAIERTITLFNNKRIGIEIAREFLDDTINSIRYCDKELASKILLEVGL